MRLAVPSAPKQSLSVTIPLVSSGPLEDTPSGCMSVFQLSALPCAGLQRPTVVTWTPQSREPQTPGPSFLLLTFESPCLAWLALPLPQLCC